MMNNTIKRNSPMKRVSPELVDVYKEWAEKEMLTAPFTEWTRQLAGIAQENKDRMTSIPSKKRKQHQYETWIP